MRKQILFLTVVLFAAGCTFDTPPEKTPAIYCLSSKLGGSDPIEPFNRSMYEVHDAVLRWGYRPVGYVWGTIFPQWGIDRFNCFTDNVGFPPRMISSLLQARFKGAGIELCRFVVNAVGGVGGLFEVADPWLNLKRQDEDFGQAFASWGIGSGCYVFLPFYGSSNVRDSFGMIFDAFCDPKTYFYGGQAFTAVNRLASGYGAFDAFHRSQMDGYEVMRDYYLQLRRIQTTNSRYLTQANEPASEKNEQVTAVNRHKLTGVDTASRFLKRGTVALDNYASDGSANDTLRALQFNGTSQTIWPFLSPWNSDFYRNGKVYSLTVIPGRPKLDYKFYPAPKNSNKNAPLVIVQTGLGAHYSAGNATGFAELAHKRGYPVMVFSNVFHPDFLRSAADGYCAGLTPIDAVIGAHVIRDAVAQLRDAGDFDPRGIILTGYSHGGMLSLFMAAEVEGLLPLPLEKVVAVNVPVDAVGAVEKIDDFFKIAEQWSMDEAEKKIADAVAVFNRGGNFAKLDEDTAKAAVGLAFRLTLRDAIFVRHRYVGIPALTNPYKWGDRYNLYIEINQLDFSWYTRNVLLDYYRDFYKDDTLGIDEMRRMSSLYAIENVLRNDPRIHVIHSADDILISDDEAEFLEKSLGERLTVFSNGGHLGNLYRPEFQEQFSERFPSMINSGELNE